MRVAVTRSTKSDEKFANYLDWLHNADASVECITISHERGNLSEMELCNGLLLTGGGDVHPKFFGKDDVYHHTEDVDEKRDAFEFSAVRCALDRRIPVLGICRGLQVANVFLGGSLHLDLAAEGFDSHISNKEHKSHEIILERNSMLGDLTGASNGEVNSYHHQAASIPGSVLKVSARSADGVIEAMEWDTMLLRSFLLLVQWHPERMSGRENKFSKNIAQKFLEAVHKTQTT
ncbi:MAG: gamma-glutamyl-gamma-aminobutyrate hydrolase family protein [Bacteroidota bacterium]|nr:gamma-glutamyl-gamma-aminobutyrate hydrolase family protein [Bacteroidota bacterium]